MRRNGATATDNSAVGDVTTPALGGGRGLVKSDVLTRGQQSVGWYKLCIPPTPQSKVWTLWIWLAKNHDLAVCENQSAPRDEMMMRVVGLSFLKLGLKRHVHTSTVRLCSDRKTSNFNGHFFQIGSLSKSPRKRVMRDVGGRRKTVHLVQSQQDLKEGKPQSSSRAECVRRKPNKRGRRPPLLH